MDEAYNSHRPHIRRKNRSLQNLNHLSLAPLTLRLPLSDPESLAALEHYELTPDSRSGETTPSTYSRRSSRPSAQRSSGTSFQKSKSSTFLKASNYSLSNAMAPRGTKSQYGTPRDLSRQNSLSHKHGIDSDWLLRTGDVLALTARESKGQAWLVSRASSIGMTKLRDDDDKESGHDITRERGRLSRQSSTRGSIFGGFDDEYCSAQTSSCSISPASRDMTQPVSRITTRMMSRCGSKPRLHNSHMAVEPESYFDCKDSTHEYQDEAESEFLENENIDDEELEQQDDAMIRRLAEGYTRGLGGWVEKMLGWKFLADSRMGQSDNDSDIEYNGENDSSNEPNGPSSQNHDSATRDVKVIVPPPEEGEISVLRDASWILGVAIKLIL